MTMELIFSVVTLVVTGLLGMFTKNSVIPSRFIPLQNLVIGIVAGLFAVYFGLFDDIVLAIFIGVGMAFSAGGVYDFFDKLKK